jgi:hypothetical protein
MCSTIATSWHRSLHIRRATRGRSRVLARRRRRTWWHARKSPPPPRFTALRAAWSTRMDRRPCRPRRGVGPALPLCLLVHGEGRPPAQPCHLVWPGNWARMTPRPADVTRGRWRLANCAPSSWSPYNRLCHCRSDTLLQHHNAELKHTPLLAHRATDAVGVSRLDLELTLLRCHVTPPDQVYGRRQRCSIPIRSPLRDDALEVQTLRRGQEVVAPPFDGEDTRQHCNGGWDQSVEHPPAAPEGQVAAILAVEL